MSPESILAIAVSAIILALAAIFVSGHYANRHRRYSAVYRFIGQTRRQSQYPADTFAHAPESRYLQTFLQCRLQVPATFFGSQNTSSDVAAVDPSLVAEGISRVVTLWMALGGDAVLSHGCAGKKAKSASAGHTLLWTGFTYQDERWVYWVDPSGATHVDMRRDFFRRHDLASYRRLQSDEAQELMSSPTPDRRA